MKKRNYVIFAIMMTLTIVMSNVTVRDFRTGMELTKIADEISEIVGLAETTPNGWTPERTSRYEELQEQRQELYEASWYGGLPTYAKFLVNLAELLVMGGIVVFWWANTFHRQNRRR